MSDYRIKITVRNARLLRAIEKAGYQPGQKFAEAAGISYTNVLLPYLNLTRSPVTPDGLFRECAWDLCDFLGVSPSDLWSDAQMIPLEKNYSSAEIDAASLMALTGGAEPVDPQQIAMLSQGGDTLWEAVDIVLSPRDASLMRDRFVVGLTLDEIGHKYDISSERVRGIEAKSIQRLGRFKDKKIGDAYRPKSIGLEILTSEKDARCAAALKSLE